MDATSAKWNTPLSPSVSSTLDLARWVSALLVLIYHLRINVLIDPQVHPASYAGVLGQAVYLVTMIGPQAVMWFFVISGFLVGGSVVSQLAQNRFTFGNYALHRATRLYVVLIPALLIGLALDSLRIMRFGISAAPSAGGESARSYTLATFLANIFFLQDLGAPRLGSNNALWSISDEAWYYALFPLLLAPFMVRKSRAMLGALFLPAVIIIAACLHANREMVILFAVWLLGVGVRLMPFRLFSSLTLAWLLAAVVILFYPLYHRHFHGAFFFPSLAFANVLLTASREKNLPSPRIAAFNAKLAGFSFSLYVLHSPLLHFLLTTFFHQPNPRIGLPIGWYSLAVSLLVLLIVYLCAWSFSLITERKTDAIRRWLAGVVGLRKS